jgi:hypothetical protein
MLKTKCRWGKYFNILKHDGFVKSQAAIFSSYRG